MCAVLVSRISVSVCLCARVCVHTRKCAFVRACVRVYVCVRAFVRACVCICEEAEEEGVFISGDVFFPPFLPVNSLVFLVQDFDSSNS